MTWVRARTKGPAANTPEMMELHFGAPYLWGGNSPRGIDCSGLVSAALEACGIACPGDSDLQRDALGEELAEGAALERGDLKRDMRALDRGAGA